MTTFAALYVKELKELRLMAAFSLVITVAIGLYVIVEAHAGPTMAAQVFLFLFPYLSALVLPFLLIHAFSGEWSGGTHYQLLSLPVSRVLPMVAKVAASWSLGAALFVVNTTALHATWLRMETMLDAAIRPEVNVVDGWTVLGAMYFGTLLLLSGIACVAAVVKLLVPRFKGLAAAGGFLLGVYLHGMIRELVLPGLEVAIGRSSLEPIVGMGNVALADVHTSLLYTSLIGVLFVAVGALMFDRLVEA